MSSCGVGALLGAGTPSFASTRRAVSNTSGRQLGAVAHHPPYNDNVQVERLRAGLAHAAAGACEEVVAEHGGDDDALSAWAGSAAAPPAGKTSAWPLRGGAVQRCLDGRAGEHDALVPAPPNHSQHPESPAAGPLRARLPSFLGDTCLGVWVGCASDTASTYPALHCQLQPAPRVSKTQCVLIDG